MVDIIVLLLLLTGFFIGLKRGLFKQVMRFVSSILALAIAYALAGQLSPVLSTVIPFPNIGSLSLLNLVLGSGMIENAYYFVIAFFITFIVAKIVLMILTSVLNIAARIPVLKQVNSVAGGLFGLVEAGILVFVVLLVASFVPVEAVQTHLQGSILAGMIADSTPSLIGMIQSIWI